MFIVVGLVVIVLGNVKDWRWVNAPWFRLAHLFAIAVVVAEAWSGIICPLTTFEGSLRAQAGFAPYRAGFVEHWLQRLLYYEAPPWAFVLGYTLFGLLVWSRGGIFRPCRRRLERDT